MVSISVRAATDQDAVPISDIYRPYVLDTAISFEMDPPSASDFASRIRSITANYPWLVAVEADSVLGYAYAGPHRSRAAYRFSVETSIYIGTAHQTRGVGRLLYEALFAKLRQGEWVHAYAGTTLPNPASVAFHERMGFRPIGVFPSVGFKFDQWHDVAWFHRPIGEDPTPTRRRGP